MDIEPALTPEGWNGLQKRGVTGSPRWDDLIGLSADDLLTAIAVANWAIPDDDPRKITRRDVYILQKAAEFIDDTEDVDGPLSTYVRSIAAKLAALLPPDA